MDMPGKCYFYKQYKLVNALRDSGIDPPSWLLDNVLMRVQGKESALVTLS